MVPLAVITDTLGRDLLQLRLERVHVAGACDLGSVGKPKHEIPKGTLLREQPAEIAQKRGRPFLQECKSLGMRAGPELRVARVQNGWDIGQQLANPMREFEAGLRTVHVAARKLHIGDDGKKVLAVLTDLFFSIFVVGAQQDLWPRALSYKFVGDVDSLANHAS